MGGVMVEGEGQTRAGRALSRAATRVRERGPGCARAPVPSRDVSRRAIEGVPEAQRRLPRLKHLTKVPSIPLQGPRFLEPLSAAGSPLRQRRPLAVSPTTIQRWYLQRPVPRPAQYRAFAQPAKS